MAFDRNDSADLAALKTEVTTDPDGLGYIPDQPYEGIVDLINAKSPSYIVSKPSVSAAAVRSATIYDSYDSLSIDEQEWLRWITGSNGVNEESLIVTSDLRLQLTDAEGDGTNSIWAAAHRVNMNAAMLALIDVEGSRAENLFGYGTNISYSDWIAARDV